MCSPAQHSAAPGGVESPTGAAAWKTHHREQENSSRVNSGSWHLVLSVARRWEICSSHSMGEEVRPREGCSLCVRALTEGRGSSHLTGAPPWLAWKVRYPKGSTALPLKVGSKGLKWKHSQETEEGKERLTSREGSQGSARVVPRVGETEVKEGGTTEPLNAWFSPTDLHQLRFCHRPAHD